MNTKLIWMAVGLAAVLLLGCAVIAWSFSFSRDAEQNDLAYFGGSGIRNMNPPASHTVRKDETMYDIAREYGVPYFDLVIENRLTGEAPLLPGTTIIFPRYHEDDSGAPGGQPASVTINANYDRSSAPVRVDLSADQFPADPNVRCVWDLGNNRFSFDQRPVAVYIRPGVYHPRLVMVDASGFYTFSNTLTVRVTGIAAEYDGLPYLALERVGEILSVEERVRDAQGIPVVFDGETEIMQDPPLLSYMSPDTFIARKGGFSRVSLIKGPHRYVFYLFVSPFPARLSVEPEYDWYKTQFDTGMYGNCGPASAASAIKWANGTDLTVERVREEIGMPYENGAVDYGNLRENMKRHGVDADIRRITTADDVTTVIDEQGIVIVSFNCGVVTPATGPEETDFVGRYYPDATGHYLLIKGYTVDRQFFVVYDAIPGDWAENRLRYADGVSQIGRNRFFSIREVMSSIRGRDMLAVYRE